jgi:mono/diheme cytochrome c family protein
MRTISTTIALLFLAASAASWAADAKAGKAAYDRACKSCHGLDGAPVAAVGKMMKVEMRDLRSPEVQAASDADLKKIVTDGKGKMTAVKSVTGAAIDDVVAHTRSLKK